MGQLLLPDNLPNIQVGGVNSLTLAATNMGQPTLVTVGGQQYSVPSILTLATNGTGANGLDTGSLGSIQLWYVYAIVNQSTFAVALVASQTAPSTGPLMPSGYGTAYKAIGAFYTNGSNQVGSVVSSLFGAATTSWMSFTPTIKGVTADPSLGSGAQQTGFWRRNEDTIEVDFEIVGGTGTTTGTGGYYFPLPGGLSPDQSRTNTGIAGFTPKGPSSTATSGGGSYALIACSFGNVGLGSNVIALTDSVGNSVSSTNVGMSDGRRYGVTYKVPVVGWNATLL